MVSSSAAQITTSKSFVRHLNIHVLFVSVTGVLGDQWDMELSSKPIPIQENKHRVRLDLSSGFIIHNALHRRIIGSNWCSEFLLYLVRSYAYYPEWKLAFTVDSANWYWASIDFCWTFTWKSLDLD
jgi:hypothetical protein